MLPIPHPPLVIDMLAREARRLRLERANEAREQDDMFMCEVEQRVVDDFWGIDKHAWQLQRDEERRKHIFISKTEEMRRMMVHVGAIQVAYTHASVYYLCYFSMLPPFLPIYSSYSPSPPPPHPPSRSPFSLFLSLTPRSSINALAYCPKPSLATSMPSIDTTKQATNCSTSNTSPQQATRLGSFYDSVLGVSLLCQEELIVPFYPFFMIPLSTSYHYDIYVVLCLHCQSLYLISIIKSIMIVITTTISPFLSPFLSPFSSFSSLAFFLLLHFVTLLHSLQIEIVLHIFPPFILTPQG